MSDLLPCPFCGATQANHLIGVQPNGYSQQRTGDPDQDKNRIPSWYEGACYRCDFVGPGFDTEQEAINHWNTRALPAVQPKVKPLVWEDVMIDRGDGHSEPSGDYEAHCAWGSYYIEMGFGSDSYYWSVETMGRAVGRSFDDPDAAKAAAQADHEARILSALEPAVRPDAAAIREAVLNEADYDAGLLNDFGGGDVNWWHDYLRAEIGRANEYWRALIDNPGKGGRG